MIENGWVRNQELGEEAERQAIERAREVERKELDEQLSRMRDYAGRSADAAVDTPEQEGFERLDREPTEHFQEGDVQRERSADGGANRRELDSELHRRGDYGSPRELEGEREAKAGTVDAKLARDFPEAKEKLDGTSRVEYLSDEDFESVRRGHGVEVKEGEELCGFHDLRDGRTFVRDGLGFSDEYVTSLHERLHSMSPEAPKALPAGLYEGMTEHMAKKEAGPWGELRDIRVSFQDVEGKDEMVVVSKRPGEAYPEEAKLVSMIESVAGEDAVKEAYFKGDVEKLRNAVDGAIGSGSFNEILDETRAGRIREAQELVKHRWEDASHRFPQA